MSSNITSAAVMQNAFKRPSIASKNIEPSANTSKLQGLAPGRIEHLNLSASPNASHVDTFERKPISSSKMAELAQRPVDSGKTDQYKAMKGVLDTGVKAGDDMLVDQQVEALIKSDAKPKTKGEQDARNAFLNAAAKAGYDVSNAPNKTNR